MMVQHGSSRGRLTNWVDVPNDGSLNGFAKSNNLDSSSLQSLKEGVIVLPRNTMLREEMKVNLFPRSTKDLSLYLREKGLQMILYEDGREKRELILDSADIILPILFFVGQVATQLGLNLCANWIYDRLVRGKEKQQLSVRAEYAQIDHKGTVIRWRKIEGPAKDVRELLLEESKALARQNHREHA